MLHNYIFCRNRAVRNPAGTRLDSSSIINKQVEPPHAVMLALCGLLGWEHSTIQPANLARKSALGPGAAALWRCVWPWDLHLTHTENYHFLPQLPTASIPSTPHPQPRAPPVPHNLPHYHLQDSTTPPPPLTPAVPPPPRPPPLKVLHYHFRESLKIFALY